MKTIYSIFRVALVAISVFAGALSANATKGDFGAWDHTTLGHNGLNSGALEFTEKNMTLETWLYIDDEGGNNKAGVNVISNRHNGNNGFSVNLANNSATSKEDIRFVFKNTNVEGASDQAFTLFLPREEFSNQWGHLAFVISSEEQKAYAYLNGELYDVVEDFYTSWVGNRVTDQLWVGRWYSNDPTFYGKMADFRVWTVARTEDEIAENYNQRLAGAEDGLYIYYNFDNFDQVITNVANPGTNDGSLLPSDTWSDLHTYELLSAIPTNVVKSENSVTWNGTADSFDVEIIEAGTGDVVVADVVTGNSYSLEDLDLDGSSTYYARVRALNTVFYSDWANSSSGSSIWTTTVEGFSIYTADNSIIVNSDITRSINVFAIDGRLVRSVDLTEGKNVIDNISKGIYLVENQKVIVR